MREPSVPARREGASASRVVTPSALVQELESAIRARLDPMGDADEPPLSEGVEPLLQKIREVRLQLFPQEGEVAPPPPKREVVRKALAKTLDETEDVLEALLLKVPGAHPFSRGEEG